MSDRDLLVELSDGRKLSVPVEFVSEGLLEASKGERENWYLIAGGIGIHLARLNEDIALHTLLEFVGAESRDAVQQNVSY